MQQDNLFNTFMGEVKEFGLVQSMNHPIAFIAGLPGAQLNELILFETGDVGQVFLIEETQVHVLVFSTSPLKVGVRATRTNKFPNVPVGKELLGKIIDPLGNPFSDEENYVRPTEFRDIEAHPLGMAARSRIKTPFLTGISIVDMMVPLGKGQKELIIGDRKTGKTSFLLTTIKNQVNNGAIAIYAAIGKKKSDIKEILDYFKSEGIEKSVVTVATSSYDSPSLIFLTPYSATTIAEHFRDQGNDVVVVFDDLSTHAKFYREIALLAKRFPGRDSYPGDIFYTHARLLERAGNFKHKEKGEVSITMLPVADIIEGDFTGYIATNLMGMTDGHIFFDSNAYSQGRRPAVNIPLSVTRVGRQSSAKILRSINRELTAFLALYQRMQDLSHFGAELTDAVKQVLRTGDVVYKFFEQTNDVIVPLGVQTTMFSMLWLKMFDDAVILDQLAQYRDNLIKAYYNPNGKPSGFKSNKEFFDKTLEAEKFNDLLGTISKYKDYLLSTAVTGTGVQTATTNQPNQAQSTPLVQSNQSTQSNQKPEDQVKK